MAINGKDIKILWGRSGNRCTICKIQLTQDAAAVPAAFTLGEQAHIIGEKDDAPRGNSTLKLEERNSYHNLILLCPNDHTTIDKNEADWPIERLYLTKSTHELWVTETLNETVNHVKLAHQAALGAIIDSAVEKCGLENWHDWTSFALSPNQRWPKERPDAIWAFRQQVIGAIWPSEYDELRRATITFSTLAHLAAQAFMEHGKPVGNFYVAHRFYKQDGFDPEYEKHVDEFDAWQARCFKLLKDSTKSANWFADVVRRDVKPMFFAHQGKFLIMEGPFVDMSFRTCLPEFTEEEKASLPASIGEAA